MIETLLPYLFGLVLLAIATVNGVWPARKLITMYEAKHELKDGSASKFRRLAGWFWVAAWIILTWFFATILGDWATHGDLTDALDRGSTRFFVMLELLLSFADS